MQSNGLLLAGFAVMAVASSVIVFAVWPGVALYVVAIGLFLASVLRSTDRCPHRTAPRRGATEPARP